MASYKTFFIVFVLSTSLVAAFPTLVQSSSRDDTKLRELKKYSFPNDYFSGKAHHDIEEQRESTENCEQVVKNAMICQVCTDPDTNAKHEQCAYASPSHKKAYGYEKSKVKPEKYEKKNYNLQFKKRPDLKRRQDSSESEESDKSTSYLSGYSTPSKKYDNIDDDDDNSKYDISLKSSYVPESERISKNTKKHQCEEIERDGMTCMVCKDSKTGGNFEKCSFAYQPKERVYKYSTSKSTGAPKNKKSKQKPVEKSQSYRRSDSAEINESNASEIAETQQADDDGCRDVIKDSMTCKICVHPVTRENSEQCSYSYTPDDKLYAYTQSRSYGKPKEYSSSDSEE